jgi:hypothetical protein
MGNCSERRFPWRTMSACDAERVCEDMAETGGEGWERVLEEEVVLEALEGCWADSLRCGDGRPPDVFGASLSAGVRKLGLRCDCARSMTSAPPIKKMLLMPLSSSLGRMQAKVLRRRRRERR